MDIKRPNSCQLELVRGCNMHCGFCGNYSLPDERCFMTMETAKNIAGQLAGFGKLRIEIAMRGEPTLHPELIPILEALRKANPASQLMLTTNGILLTEKLAGAMFKAGVNIILLDCYGKSRDKYIARLKKYHMFDHVKDRKSPWNFHTNKEHFIILMPDLSKYHKLTRTFTNQCGAISPEAYAKYGIKRVRAPWQKKCAMVFREIDIHYNGDVPICCRDWVGKRIMFNFAEERTLQEYWTADEQLTALRILLYNKVREQTPCNVCNYNGGYYLGFLPKCPPIDEREKVRLLKQLELPGDTYQKPKGIKDFLGGK